MRGAVEIAVGFRPRRGRRTAELLERVGGVATLREQPAGRWLATFILDPHARGYGTLAALLDQVGDKRTTTVLVDGEPEAPELVRDMAMCARPFAASSGRCDFPFTFSVPDRCRACPLYDAAQAEAIIAASYANDRRVG
jgi:hypothetical protein